MPSVRDSRVVHKYMNEKLPSKASEKPLCTSLCHSVAYSEKIIFLLQEKKTRNTVAQKKNSSAKFVIFRYSISMCLFLKIFDTHRRKNVLGAIYSVIVIFYK